MQCISSVSKTEKSDHDIVVCTLLHPEFLPQPTKKPIYVPSTPMDDINFNSADWSSINSDLLKVDWSSVLDPDISQNNAWDKFESIVADTCKRHAPSHTANMAAESSKTAKIPKSRRLLLRKKKRLNARINAIKYRSILLNTSKLQKLNKDRAELELLLKEDIKHQRLREETAVIERIKLNPKAFYTYAKRSSAFVSSVGPLLDDKKVLQSDPIKMGAILQQQYAKAFSKPNPDYPAEAYISNFLADNAVISDIDFSEQDFINAIKSMDRCSATGPDKFPVVILKECSVALAPIITQLWRLSFSSGHIASKFKTQTVVPVFKKGNRSIAENYRPVSLTSHLIKLFERVLRSKLVAFIEDNNIIHHNQHGFRAGRSCLTQLLHHIEDVMNDLNNDINADVLYLDFSKAFDKVDHSILLRKLHQYGIRGKIHQWISSFLRGRTQHVVIDGVASTIIDVISGVPQGTVLGPLLFILYINDIFEVVKNSKVKVFADDSKLQKDIKTAVDHFLLQDDLAAVVKWASDNNMELNEDKFQLLQHGKNQDLKQNYSLPSGKPLAPEVYVKDLGVYVDTDIRWRHHIALKSADAAKKAGWILRTFISRDKGTMMLLFKSLVRSIIEYCCPLWSPHLVCDIIQVESVQRSFTSKISGLSSLNYWERLKQLNLYSLQRRRERYMIILIWKIYYNLIPNDINIVFQQSGRRGVTCIRPLGSSKFSSINTMRFNSFSSTASALFNTVPAEIKSISSLTMFKSALDKFLHTFPDTPPTPGYIGQNRNSLLEWAGSISH